MKKKENMKEKSYKFLFPQEQLLYSLNIISLFLCAVLIFVRFINFARYSFIWPDFLQNIQENTVKIVFVISLLKLFLIFIKDKRKAIFATILLFLFTMLYSGGIINIRFFSTLLLIINTIEIDFENIAKVYACSVGVLLTSNIICVLVGIVPDIVGDGSGRKVRYLHGMGFGNHNAFMAYWFFYALTLAYIIKKTRNRAVGLILIIILTIVFWLFTGSNTSTIAAIGALCSILVYYAIEKFQYLMYIPAKYREFILKFLICIPLLCVLITIIGTIAYAKYGYIKNLPSTMMSRFRLTYEGLVSLGIKIHFRAEDVIPVYEDIKFNFLTGLWGQTYPGEAYFDSLYSDLLIRDGLIVLVPYVMAQVYVMYLAYKRQEYELLLILVFKSVYGLMENYAIYTIGCGLFEFLIFSSWGDKISRLQDNGKKEIGR